MNKAEYAVYLDSPGWQRRRVAALRRDTWRCRDCGANGGELHVHHLTYERVGDERPEDLITLCAACHGGRHGVEPWAAPGAGERVATWVTAIRDGLPNGTRVAGLSSLVGHLLRKGVDGYVVREIARSVGSRCQPPLPEIEADFVVETILRRELGLE